MSKTAAKILIGIWSLVLLLFAVLFGYLCYNGGWNSLPFYSSRWGTNGTYQLVHEETVEGQVDSIQLDWRGGDITVYVSSDDKVKVAQRGVKNTPEEQFFHTSFSDGTLTVSNGSTIAGLPIGPFHYSIGSDLELYLPKKTYEALTLKSGSGDVHLDRLDADTLDISTSSGDISLSGEFRELTLTSTSGDLLGRGVTAETVHIRTTSGDVNYAGDVSKIEATSTSGSLIFRTGRMVENASLHSTSGDAMLYLPENDGFTAKLSSSSGDLICDFTGLDGGRAFQYKDGGAEIRVETTSGDAFLLRG